MVSHSASKPKTTAKEQPTKKSIQPPISKVAPRVAPSKKRAASVETVEDPADRPRSKSPLDPSRILKCADGSDDETENNHDQDATSDIEILEEPAESAEAELSKYQHSIAIH